VISVELKSEEITDTLAENEGYSIHLFDRETLRINIGDREVFVDIEDADTAVDKAREAEYSTLTELDRKMITRIWSEKNGRYAALAKRFREDAHSGDYLETIEFIEDGELSPREILGRFDEIVETAIENLEQYIQDEGWPDDLEQ
jgi:hypothetical protein